MSVASPSNPNATAPDARLDETRATTRRLRLQLERDLTTTTYGQARLLHQAEAQAGRTVLEPPVEHPGAGVQRALDLVTAALEDLDRSARTLATASAPQVAAMPVADAMMPEGGLGDEADGVVETGMTSFRTKVKLKAAAPADSLDDAARDADATTDGITTAADDLTRIRGISAELALQLQAYGVRTFREIAAWARADRVRVTEAFGLGRRISREGWIEQAAMLAMAAAGPQERSTAIPISTAMVAVARAPSTAGEPLAEAGSADPVRRGASLREALAASLLQRPQAVPSAAEVVAVDEAVGDGVVVADADDVTPDKVVEAAADEPADVVPERAASLPIELGLAAIRGLSADHRAELVALGVSEVAAIAEWTSDDVAEMSVLLGPDARIGRDGWIEQAAVLAAGQPTAYARRLARGDFSALVPAPAPEIWYRPDAASGPSPVVCAVPLPEPAGRPTAAPSEADPAAVPERGADPAALAEVAAELEPSGDVVAIAESAAVAEPEREAVTVDELEVVTGAAASDVNPAAEEDVATAAASLAAAPGDEVDDPELRALVAKATLLQEALRSRLERLQTQFSDIDVPLPRAAAHNEAKLGEAIASLRVAPAGSVPASDTNPARAVETSTDTAALRRGQDTSRVAAAELTDAADVGADARATESEDEAEVVIVPARKLDSPSERPLSAPSRAMPGRGTAPMTGWRAKLAAAGRLRDLRPGVDPVEAGGGRTSLLARGVTPRSRGLAERIEAYSPTETSHDRAGRDGRSGAMQEASVEIVRTAPGARSRPAAGREAPPSQVTDAATPAGSDGVPPNSVGGSGRNAAADKPTPRLSRFLKALNGE